MTSEHSDQLAAIRRLRELNAKRTPGPYTFRHPDDPESPWQIAKRNGWDMERPSEQDLVDDEFQVALANACDAGLLDAAELGEAFGERLDRIADMIRNSSNGIDDIGAEDCVSRLYEFVFRAAGILPGDKPLVKAVEDLKAERDEALARGIALHKENVALRGERDRLRGLLVEWVVELTEGTRGLEVQDKLWAKACELAEAQKAKVQGE